MSDVYSSPEKYGLEIVDKLDFEQGCYHFDLLCVWKDAFGNMYESQDCGDSGHSPFGFVYSIDELEKITDFEGFKSYVLNLKKDVTLEEKLNFLDNVKKAIT